MMNADTFLARWASSAGSERANAQPFFLDLCDLLNVPRPATGGDGFDDYRFEKPLEIPHPDGHRSVDRIDLYKRGCFVIEAKQAQAEGSSGSGPRRNTRAWFVMMEGAFAQGRNYAVNLPEGRPPFLITCDIGHCFEIWAGFGGDYGRYGARRTIPLTDLAREEVRQELAAIFTDPWSLDPARRAARVTREIASYLADLARALEADGSDPETVARFLMRCLFTMFAEDVGLLEGDLFTATLRDVWIPHPERFPAGVEALWKEMNRGGMYGPHPIRRFNGGLFREVHAIPLTRTQLDSLSKAAQCDWSDVEPAIFGTMLERALDPHERHRLGAHFTPREYIERLVRPTVIEPLRAEWDAARAVARQIMEPEQGMPTSSNQKAAGRLLQQFLQRLCATRVLDPACGTGNFLYVTFDLVKQLEAEVLREMADLGDAQLALELAGVRVVPEQFIGIEINPRAQAIAELVLWLGYLQWARRAGVTLADPVLRDTRNIACRDAILDHAPPVLRRDAAGRPETVWDMHTLKMHPITGREVPDEAAQVVLSDYPNARAADWPQADFIVSNPPFLGNKRMREALGDGYAEALRRAWPHMEGSADLVMYWWDKAAERVRHGHVRRFGFITTNSITQTFNRKVLESHMKATHDPLAIAWAIPDHPWVLNGAAVRIAMSVGCRASDLLQPPVLGQVLCENDPDCAPTGAARLVDVDFRSVVRIHPDLSGGANVADAVPLKANMGLSYQGMNLVGQGFRLSRQEVEGLGYDPNRLPPVIRPYMNARELTQKREDRFVIDLFGLDADEARQQHPALYQWLLERVKPERDHNKRDSYRLKWWIFGEPRSRMRPAMEGLSRFVITPETAKHRFFVFAPLDLLPDHQLYAVCTDDALVHGVLSSRHHIAWALAAGATLEDRPRWRNNACFDPFPFPDATESQKTRIRALAEHLDAHRKQVQAAHPEATMTVMYNALLRVHETAARGASLTDRERAFHDAALIGVLQSLHHDLDVAVAEAYGWPADLPSDEIVTRLVSLNAIRAAEEQDGFIRWLRPEFQRPRAGVPDTTPSTLTDQALPDLRPSPRVHVLEPTARPWPKDRYDQIKAVRDLMATRPGTWTAATVAATFKSASPDAVRRHLSVLERIGVLVAYKDPHGEPHWHIGTA